MTDPAAVDRIAHVLDDTTNKTVDIEIEENIDFNAMLLPEPILRGLAKAGFRRPSPIQLKAIPTARCGVDLVVQAKSGTGKTCVFVVVALETVVLSSATTQVLILAPTREIALQSFETVLSIGCCIPELKCTCVIGGTSLKSDKATSKQCHIVVGTPGRVCQLIKDGDLSIDAVRLFVLDEADKLMDESYQESVNWIFSQLPMNKQLMVLSATFPRQLDEFLSKYMKKPQMIKLDSTDVQLVGIKQYVRTVVVPPGEDWLEKKVESLHELLSKVAFSQCLIFCNFQDKAELLCAKLKAKQWPVEFIASQLHQTQRSNVMKRLKKFKCRILVSTDLTARGIDAEHVNLVINFDVPFTAETYFHRIGRAGRFGGYGAAITILCGWQTEYSFYQMAADQKFRAKKLPAEFPLDLAANESFYEKQPALELPDMKYLERKAAAKSARKNVPLQPDDFYGQLMKTCSYKIHRSDPDVYKFPSSIVEQQVPKENNHCKYDRSEFENILRDVLGVKNGATKNPKKRRLENEKRTKPMSNGVVESTSSSSVCASSNLHESDLECGGSSFVSSSCLEDLSQPEVVDDHVSNDGKTGEKHYEEQDGDKKFEVCENASNGDVATTVVEKNTTKMSEETTHFTEIVVNGDDKKVITGARESHAIERNNVGENDDVSSDAATTKENIEIREEIVVTNNADDSSTTQVENVATAEEIPVRPSLSYFDAFSGAIDSHLCHLYGGSAWHYQRSKIIRENQNATEENDTPSSVDYGKYVISYSRDELLKLWTDVAVKDRRIFKREAWYERAKSLGLLVRRSFQPAMDVIESAESDGDRENAASVDKGDQKFGACCECWNAYGKVLKDYEKYVKSLTVIDNTKSWRDYAKSVKSYGAFIKQNKTVVSSSSMPLPAHVRMLECRNVMKVYNRLMSESK